MKNTTNILFLAGFVLCLLQIWLPSYYMTGDGPCHVANAQIVHDLWIHQNTAFYTRFFALDYQPDPNWYSTAILALLMFIVKGAVAEKILLSVYVLLFTGGFYLLLKKISNSDIVLPLVIFIFVFTHSLSMGFYNSSISISFYFWMVWTWLCFLDKRNIGYGMLFFLSTAFVFFTHLLAFGFGVFTCAALLTSYAIASPGTGRQRFMGFFLKYAVWLAVFIVPFIFLMRWFTEKEGGLQMELGHHFYRLVELVQFKYATNVTRTEVYPALVGGVGILLFFCIALVKRFSNKQVNKYDGFMLSLLFALFVYVCFPDIFLGKLIIIGVRVQLFVLILMICCVAYMLPAGKLKNAGSVLLFGCFIWFSILRIPVLMAAANAEEDLLSGASYIKPHSIVLPLNFSPNGTDEHGGMVADGNYLFSHATQYLVTEKPTIVLDNYEANMGYFPLRWQDKTNPYYHLSKYDGIEGVPPAAAIEEYRFTSDVIIDYVLLWCYEPKYLQNIRFNELYTEINAHYHIVYSSPTKRTILFERN